MKKSKNKKRVALPLIIIALALCAIVAVTIFTTPVLYIIYENTYTYEDGETDIPYDFRANKKLGWITEIVYKSHPSLYNLQIVESMYDINYYLRGVYYGFEAPKDYVEKSLKYSKLMYETEYDEKANSYYAVPVGVVNKDYWKINTSFHYMIALYVHGDIDEMKKVCEETVALTLKADDNAHYYYAYSFKDLFYLIMSDSKDETLKAWTLEKEKQINDYVKSTGKMELFYLKYDNIYTNPNYDDYIKYNWEENSPGYYDYNDITRVNEENG